MKQIKLKYDTPQSKGDYMIGKNETLRHQSIIKKMKEERKLKNGK